MTGVRSPSDRTGGTLRVVAPPIDSLDPQRSYLPGVWNLMRLYTRTLVTYSSEPGATDQLVPDLATDLGTPSEDGLSWTFTLREGVRFETGRPITARDVKYGIERSFASDVVVGGPTYVVDLLDDPANPYAGPYQDESPDRLGLAAVETPDDRTIIFRLRAPQSDLPFVLALPSSSPVPIENDSGARLRDRPRLLGSVRHHVRRRRRRASSWSATPSGTRPPTTCGPPCPTASSSGPGCRASSGTRRCSPVRPTSTSPGPACSRPRRHGWRRRRTTRCASASTA